jgi:uncharacterized DUF497 family protein
MLSFEWDAKAKANLAKHGVSFGEAREAFRDPLALELFDDRFAYGEERYVLIAMVRGRCLTVVRTRRGPSSDLGACFEQSRARCLFRSAGLNRRNAGTSTTGH